MPANFSIIIPVYEETNIINSAIAAIRALRHSENAEIIVVDGHPQGSTISEISDTDVIKIISPKGRSRQFNYGAAKSSGDTLIFLHADTRLPAAALDLISAALLDHDIIGGAFDLGIESKRFAYRLIERMASWRSRRTRIPYGDQAIFIRADYFRTLGGFSDIPLMEDVELMQRIKQKNGQIKIIDTMVLTSPRRWEKEGIIFCTLRNWLLISLFLLGAKPASLARFYK